MEYLFLDSGLNMEALEHWFNQELPPMLSYKICDPILGVGILYSDLFLQSSVAKM